MSDDIGRLEDGGQQRLIPAQGGVGATVGKIRCLHLVLRTNRVELWMHHTLLERKTDVRFHTWQFARTGGNCGHISGRRAGQTGSRCWGTSIAVAA